MVIQIFIDWFLPAYKAGGPVQTIANLVAQPVDGVEYKVVCSNKDVDGTTIEVAADQWLPWNPWTDVYYASRRGPKELLGTEADVLFINGIYSFRFNLLPLLLSRAKRTVVSVRGMVLPGALSQKKWKKKVYLALWRVLGLHRKAAFHACNAEERAAIEAVFGREVTIHVAANYPRVFKQQAFPEKKRGELRLVSVALISPMKNILPVLQALQTVPDTVAYHLYGGVKDAGYWQQCQEQVKRLPANITVFYHGDVPPGKVEEALASGQVFVLPSRSENFGHALFEALSAGKPLITSRQTPWNLLAEARAGLNVDPGDKAALSGAIRFFAAMADDELKAWSDGAKAYADAAVDVETIRQEHQRMFGLPQQNQNTSEQIRRCDQIC